MIEKLPSLSRRAAHQESLAADYDLGAWRFGGALLAVGARPDGSATSWCGVLDMMGLTAAAPVATVTEGSDFPR